MPDWCFNRLRLHGDADLLEELRQEVAGSKSALDFERIDRTPCELMGRKSASGTAALARAAGVGDPYGWRAEHWGCIRAADPESVRVEETLEGVLAYRLSTPWSPPEGIAATLASRCPVIRVELAFLQPARGFAGAIAFERGEEVSREECEEPERVFELTVREFGCDRAAELLDPAA